MKQPALGRKILELRKNQGLTQEELVDRCNISVRTLQRIESGEVSPRIQTTKLLFDALGYQPEKKTFPVSLRNRLEKITARLTAPGTMKKLIAVLTLLLVISVGFNLHVILSKRAHTRNARQEIVSIKAKYRHWYNTGQLDSCVSTMAKDVCLVNNWITLNGRKNVYVQLNKVQPQGYKILDHTIESFNCEGNIAVLAGTGTASTPSGEIIVDRHMETWHFTNGKWLKTYEIEVYQ